MSTKQHEKDIERFDQWSDRYENSWLQRVIFDPTHQETLALAAEIIPQPADVLDVGCGTGKLLRRVHARWPQTHLIGVDPAEGMIEIAKRQTPYATFYTGMAETLPLQDASVDLALSTISFHHWQDQAAGVRAIARVLRPGGYFILVDMSFPGWLLQVFRQRRVHDRPQMRALFNQAGLQVQTQQSLTWRRVLATVGKKP
ncbi:MAG TPA: class I SAM-dependent methyltransferase [Ktedonobacteraceae bacterium]|nr:class I SAM-dependent methyltransferase [Ktedonobacteraceae bacterium]